MNNYRLKVGYFGQKLAKNYLLAHGYEILAENYYIRGGEIDLIAKISGKIVFIEVKTRTNFRYGQAEDAVNFFKIKAMVKAAEIFLNKKNIINKTEIDFDIIAVYIFKNLKKVKIKHFRNIDVFSLL